MLKKSVYLQELPPGGFWTQEGGREFFFQTCRIKNWSKNENLHVKKGSLTFADIILSQGWGFILMKWEAILNEQ